MGFSAGVWQMLVDLGVLAAVAAASAAVLAVSDRLYVWLLEPVHRWFLFFTGLVGVPIHELTHAATARLFGLRVTRIRLFTPFAETGRLGDVGLAWNPSSSRHRAGLFFVGLAPLLVGAVVVLLLLRYGTGVSIPLLVPAEPGDLVAWREQAGGWLMWFAVAAAEWPAGLWTPAAIFAAFSISVHALPSPADLKSASKGVLLVFALGAVAIWALSALPERISLDLVGWIEIALRWCVAGIVEMTVLAVAGLALAGVVRLIFLAMTRPHVGP